MTCQIKNALVAEMSIDGKRTQFMGLSLEDLDAEMEKFLNMLRANKEKAALAKIARQVGQYEAAYKRARAAFVGARDA